MSAPGHTSTIASSEQDVKNLLQTCNFDGNKRKLKTKGFCTCGMKFMGIPNLKFSWELDLNLPVVQKTKSKQ